ncbi:MAG: tetratricopeptide repeat protein [Spirochaetales bacterium]|nr:tetratricopeptide repeat protein [Spirochaetales bacterium]
MEVKKGEMMRKIGIIVICIGILSGCTGQGEKDFIDALMSLEDSGSVYAEIDPGIREDIEEIARLYKDDLKKEVTQNEELGSLYKQLGQKYLDIAEIYRQIQNNLLPVDPGFDSPQEKDVYNKMLAIRFYDSRMYGKAYKSFHRAIELNPSNSILYYHAGVCAGWMAKSIVDPGSVSEQEEWYMTAENCYKRALELDPYYVDALYGYSILLIIELDRANEGIEYVKKILEKEKKNTNALFLLARAYYQIGDYEQALDNYDRILDITQSVQVKEKVRILKEQVKDKQYESE